MQKLIASLKDTDANVEQQLRYLIGRGQGLTPSGDDMLVGMLFIHSIHPYIAKIHLEKIKQLINEPLTTLVSQTFLKYAVNDQFSSKPYNVSLPDEEPTLSSSAIRSLEGLSFKSNNFELN